MKDIEVLSGPSYNIGWTQDMVPPKKRKAVCVVEHKALVDMQTRLAVAEGRLARIESITKDND